MSGRIWAIQTNGIWTRWAPEYQRWDVYSEKRAYLAADPTTGQACYYIDPDASVHWRNVDQNQNKSFPGITAKQISVGGGNRLWAIQSNGVWTRWAPEHQRWDVYSEKRAYVAADPTTGQACYYIDLDGSVHWRNVDQNQNKSFPGITAKQISVGGDNRLWAIQSNGIWTRWAPEHQRWDLYSETRTSIAADPTTGQACYYIDPDGAAHWRNVDQNQTKDFPGITAKQISVGGS
ncbi:hypothetical protein WMF20_18605 [Sorangium sp. So ce834]|uniref:hypothetical protein n=1 Tax=Sorangium sp. So ce834 TaxID=3133321 RepID=UPI003F63F74C